MENAFPVRRIAIGLVAAVVVLFGGTIGFHQILGENWMQSFYPAVTTTSLAGIDSVPDNSVGQAVSVLFIFCGVTIFAFLGALVVEAIARGVVSGPERRRRKAIEKLHDHTIICGYGCVGQRIADEFHGAGAASIVAVAKREGTYHTRPSPETVFDAGDVIIGVGTSDDIRALEDLFAPAGASVSS